MIFPPLNHHWSLNVYNKSGVRWCLNSSLYSHLNSNPVLLNHYHKNQAAIVKSFFFFFYFKAMNIQLPHLDCLHVKVWPFLLLFVITSTDYYFYNKTLESEFIQIFHTFCISPIPNGLYLCHIWNDRISN